MEKAPPRQRQQHVAVLAFPFGTHAAPLLNLARRLAAAATAESAIFSFFSTAESNASVFSGDEDAGKVRPYDVRDGLEEGKAFSGGSHMELIEIFLGASPGNFRDGIRAAVAETGREVSCLLGDAFLWFGAEMAEEFGVPWVAFWTAGPCSLSLHYYTDAIRERFGRVDAGTLAKKEDECLNFIPGLSAISLKDIPKGILFGDLDSPFSIMLHKMARNLPRATAVAVNSYEELDSAITADLSSKLHNFLCVAPADLAPSSDDHNCLSWLDDRDPASVAYISFGTVATPPPNELAAIAEALDSGGFSFLWSIRGESQKLLPGFDRKSGKFVPWAPQARVLKHASIGVFVTHGGWNSVSESVAGGVPMICRPFFGDQMLNSAVVEDVWKVGLKVEGGVFRREGTVEALELVLRREGGKKMRERCGALKLLFEKAVGAHGSTARNFKSLADVVLGQN